MVTIPQDWCKKQLQDICVPSGLVRGPFGGSLKKEIFQSSGKKVYEQKNAIYRSANIGNYYITNDKYRELARFAVVPGDFIVSCSGTIGKIFRLPETAPQGVINQALLKISLDSSICDPEYFYKYFEWSKFQNLIIDDTQGGAMKNLVGMDKFKKTEFIVPRKVSEQKEIANVLSEITVYIDDLSELIKKKCSIRDGALEDLMSGRTRLQGFEEEWIIYPFNNYFSLLPTNTCSREQLCNKGEVGNIHYGDILVKYSNILNAADEIPRLKDISKIREQSYLQINDILIADTAEDETVGKAVQIGKISTPLVGGLHTVACRPNYKTAEGFLGYYMNSSLYHDQLYPYITGIKVSSVSKKSLGETNLRIPADIKEQEAIVSVLITMDDEIEALEAEREKMIQIREGAMDDLLTGRVRLKV